MSGPRSTTRAQLEAALLGLGAVASGAAVLWWPEPFAALLPVGAAGLALAQGLAALAVATGLALPVPRARPLAARVAAVLALVAATLAARAGALGLTLTHREHPPALWWIAAAGCVTAALLALRLARREREPGCDPTEATGSRPGDPLCGVNHNETPGTQS